MGLQVLDTGDRVRVAARLLQGGDQRGLIAQFVGGWHAPDSES